MLPDLPPAQVETEYLAVELIAAEQAFRPGSKHWLGLRLKHAPHWHSYWRNPGDSGLPTRTRWTLPAGSSIGTLAWPLPQRHALGGLVNFGYADEVVLPIELSLDAGLAGSQVRIAVDVSWLVCREECIPGKALLGLERPLQRGSAALPAHADGAAIEAALAAVPRAAEWPLRLVEAGAGFELRLPAPAELGPQLELFPLQPQVLANAAPQLRREGTELVFSAARSEYYTRLPQPFEVLLVDAGSGRGYVVTATPP